MRTPILSLFLVGTIAACSTVQPPAEPQAPPVSAERPLQVIPADTNLDKVRADLVATASERFGQSRVDEAIAAPAHLIAKRFAGMLPPPPPGQTSPEYVPPAALLMKGPQGWVSATAAGWRPLNADKAAEIERVIADPAFWSEPPTNLPCPDYGSSLLLLKVPGRAETVRKSSCSSIADKAVMAALDG